MCTQMLHSLQCIVIPGDILQLVVCLFIIVDILHESSPFSRFEGNHCRITCNLYHFFANIGVKQRANPLWNNSYVLLVRMYVVCPLTN